MLLINLWSFTTKDAVIGVSLHGNLDVSLHNCQVLRCSAAGLVLHFEMFFGEEKEIRKPALFYLVTFQLLSCTPLKFNIAHEKRPSQKESTLPIIIFHGLWLFGGVSDSWVNSCPSRPSEKEATLMPLLKLDDSSIEDKWLCNYYLRMSFWVFVDFSHHMPSW